ncbi:MAG: hypothetical protein ACRDV9_11580 [Acidimicrobiia bacterium]
MPAPVGTVSSARPTFGREVTDTGSAVMSCHFTAWAIAFDSTLRIFSTVAGERPR